MSGARVYRGDRMERMRDDRTMPKKNSEMGGMWQGYTMGGRGYTDG